MYEKVFIFISENTRKEYKKKEFLAVRRWCKLNSHLHLDGRVRIVADDLKVLELEVVDVRHLSLELQLREWTWRALQLLLQRSHMVQVNVSVAQGVNEVAGRQVGDVSNHVSEESVRRNIERHAEPHVGRALVQLAAELAIRDVELRQAVTGRQSHLRDLHRVPGSHDDAPVGGVHLDALDDLLQLVDSLAGVVVVAGAVLGAEVPPLKSINRSQIADLAILKARRVEELARAVAIPDSDVLGLQQLGVRRSFNEPQQLLGHGAPEYALGGQQRKLIAEVEAHLCTEDADGADPGAVAASDS